MTIRFPSVAFTFLLLPLCLRAGAPDRDSEGFFELNIRPVLANTCLKCHGGGKTSGGLRVTSRENLLKGGDSGPALIAGMADQSLLIRALRYHDNRLRMPPNKKLPDEVVAHFVTWVSYGAFWPGPAVLASPNESAAVARHWAFQPVKDSSPPPDSGGWAANGIDRFILARLHENGLDPVQVADKRALLRRVTFDLIGLPPTPAEMTHFIADKSPDAYAKVVDRLLASPHYGERWGRHWMDVVRYADTAGDNADYPVPEARLYRDYIIKSFNDDKPYDQFVREQLAGDILAQESPPDLYADRIIATGFIALSRRYATGPYELWPLTLEDTIDVTGQAFMGLTLRCARCHDHKFDPISAQDYYGLYGIFASTQYPWAGAEEFASKGLGRMGFMPLLPPGEAAPRLQAYRQSIKGLENQIRNKEETGPQARRLKDLTREIDQLSRPTLVSASQPDQQKLKKRLAELQEQREHANHNLQQELASMRMQLRNLQRPALPVGLPGAYAVHDGQPADAYIQLHGDSEQHGPPAKRDAPKFFTHGQSLKIPPGSSGRLQFAQWLTRPDHPLTARVMVNRIWQHHFGKGLVATPSNFGLRGEPPSHPKLLDWLAARFVKNGWSIKSIHRLILLSKTYQLSSTGQASNSSEDQGNRFYRKFNRQRLDAEAVRDAILAVSGRLNPCLPPSHPFPPMDAWAWTQHSPFKDLYPSDHRSVYLMTQRFQRHPFLALFDGPDTNTSVATRTSSTVALQALFMMNSDFVGRHAWSFAQRLIRASHKPEERIILAYQLAWSRPPSADEVGRVLNYVQRYEKQLKNADVQVDTNREAWVSLGRILLSANEFIYID